MSKFLAIVLILLVISTMASNTDAIGTEHSGSWFNPNENTHGFSIQYGDAGLLLAAAEPLVQSSSGDFEITKSTIDNGGGLSSGAEFSLKGTIGQPDASQEVAIGGEFALSGGFWANATVINVIFKDNFESD